MEIKQLELKKLVNLLSLEVTMEQMLQNKFHVKRDDLDPEEWRDLMARCYKAIRHSKDEEINDNTRHAAGNFLMIRAFRHALS